MRPSSSEKLYYSDDNWRLDAQCKYMDPNIFFPVGSSGPVRLQTENAKAICGVCPVASACLEFALENHQDDGVWGGTTEEERRVILRARRRSNLA